MFENQFKKEISKIKPDATVKESIRAQMEQLQRATPQATAKKMSKSRFPKWIPAMAAVLCVCIVSLTIWGGSTTKPSLQQTPTINGTAVIPATISYDAIYELFETIYETTKPEEPSLWKRATGALKSALGGTAVDNATVDIADGAMLESVESYVANTEETLEATEDTAGNTATATSEEYSGTNNQVAEVEESDMVKTDGKYIYILNRQSGTVTITEATLGELTQISTLRSGMNADATNMKLQAIDMYVSGDRLVLIGLEQYESEYSGNTVGRTVTQLYDISDPKAPDKLQTFAQSGYHLSSRLVDGVLYLFSNESYYVQPKKEDISTYVPQLYDGNETCPIAEENIHIFGGEVDRQYLIATSVEIQNGERIDSKTVLGGGDTIYANTESIYVAAAECTVSYVEDQAIIQQYQDTTRLIRFGIEKGILTAAAEGTVRGTALNQFSMDESAEHFRIVTTVTGSITENGSASSATETTQESGAAGQAVSAPDDATEDETSIAVSSSNAEQDVSAKVTLDTTTTNALFILDRNLKTVGQIVNLAPDERVYSVRFLGNYAYFVTFRQVDPLFAVDCSDPTAPKVLSALKIPGFSNYLHPYSDGLLLGIGKNADEETGRTGTVKLSMFDISDPANVTERDKTSLNCYYTQVDNTHKAALIDANKDLIAFMGSDAYYIYGYSKESGFVEKAKLQVDWIGGYDVRGLYIGEYLYICTIDGIDSYRLDTFAAVASLSFD